MDLFHVINDEDIEKSKIKQWTIKELNEDTEYHVCLTNHNDIITSDEHDISLIRYKNSVVVTITLSGSAKYWGHLFSLSSWITALEEVVSNEEELDVFDSDVNEPNHMYLRYGFTVSNCMHLKPVIEKANEVADSIERAVISRLVEYANNLN